MRFESLLLKGSIIALLTTELARAEWTSPFAERGIGESVPGPFYLSKSMIREKPRRIRSRDNEHGRKLQFRDWFSSESTFTRENCSWAIYRLKYE